MLDVIIGTLEIIMSRISLKYIPIHIHNFEYSRVIMNMNYPAMASFSQKYKYEEKQEYISDSDNWTSQISEVALRKELELWKFPFPPSGQ